MDTFFSEKLYKTRTPLCDIMYRNRSDKGNTPYGHNYTTVYHYLFDALRNSNINLFEMGLGTNNPNIASSMGVDGRPGASLYGWSEYFVNADIFGADIDRDILFNTGRIKTHYCDQTNKDDIGKMFSNFGACDNFFDIMIDDGLHNFEANNILLQNSIQYLKPNGVYIVEDVNFSDLPYWSIMKETLAKEFNLSRFEVVVLPCDSQINTDNNLIVVRK